MHLLDPTLADLRAFELGDLVWAARDGPYFDLICQRCILFGPYKHIYALASLGLIPGPLRRCLDLVSTTRSPRMTESQPGHTAKLPLASPCLDQVSTIQTLLGITTHLLDARPRRRHN